MQYTQALEEEAMLVRKRVQGRATEMEESIQESWRSQESVEVTTQGGEKVEVVIPENGKLEMPGSGSNFEESQAD